MKNLQKQILFKGRISRREYAVTVAILFVAIFAVSIIHILLEDFYYSNNEPLFIMLAVALAYLLWFWILFSQGAKRCHDFGHSGWWQLAFPILFLFMLFQKGHIGSNKYGEPPTF